MNKYFYIVLAIFLSLNYSFAQEKFSISGNVKSAQSGEDIMAANIAVVERPTAGAISNDYGFYSMTLPEGEYTFVFSFIGYETIRKTIVLDADKILNIELPESATALDEVVVSSERSNANIKNAEMGVSTLSVAAVSNVPVLFGEQDILKTIQLLPGVKPAGDGSSGFYVRGGSASHNLILLDDAPVYNPSHLLGFFSVFNSSSIKDVKLYKGALPAEFGGRLASVMDVKMLEGNNKEFHADGGIGLISSRLTLQAPIVENKGSFIVSARRTYADLFLKLSNDEVQRNSRLYFYDLNMKANYNLSDKDRIFVSAYFGRDVLGYANNFGFDWGNTTATVRYNRIINPKLFSNTLLIFSDYNYVINIDGGAEFDISSRIRDWNLKQKFEYFINDNNSLEFGFNVIHHTFMPGELDSKSDNLNDFFIDNKYSVETAVFVHNNYQVSEKINLSYGLRFNNFVQLGPGNIITWDKFGNPTDFKIYEKNEIIANYNGWSPRLAISYIFNEEQSLKASYAKTQQFMHMISNSNTENPTDIWLPSSNNIKPANSQQVALGYFRNFDEDKWEFSSEIYYKTIDGIIDYRTGAQTTFNADVERELLYGDGKAYGLELYLGKKVGRLNGWVSYTLSRSLNKFEQINDNKWFSAKQDRIHDFSIVANYQINDRWTLSSTWVYYTGNAVTFPSGRYQVDGQNVSYYTERNGYRMPDYHRLDLGLTYKNPDFKYQMDVKTGKMVKVKKRFNSSWNFSVYNAYGRENAFSITFEENPDSPGTFQAVQVALFKIIPSVSYNFSF